MNLNFIFYLPTFLFVASGIPQIIKLLKTKNSESISVSMYLLVCSALIIVSTDAYVHHNYTIFAANGANLVMAAIVTFLTIKYKKRKPLDI